MMAVCEVLLPASVAKPSTFLRSNCAVLEGVFGGDVLLIDETRHLVEQHRVVEHQQVGVEDAGVLLAETLADLALDLLDFVAGIDEGLLEAIELTRRFARRELVEGNDVVLRVAEDKNAPATYAG